MNQNNIMENDSIKQILTLRYDCALKKTMPELRWEDYKIKNDSKNISDFVEESITEVISDYTKNVKKVSISLSSGIDSTLVATILKKKFPDLEINSLSVTFSNSFDESPFAKKIAENLDLDHKIIYLENFLKELPSAISIVKKPFWDLHWYYIAKEAKSVSDDFFSGDGGDELFGGYTFRYSKYLSLVSENSSVEEKIRAYLSCHKRDWVPDQEKIFTSKLNFSWDEIYGVLEKFFDNELDLLDQVFLADFNGKLLYNMSPVYKEIHEHLGLSYVAPILNQKLIDYSTHLDSRKKYNSETNQGKLPLIELCKKFKVDHLISKKKRGFSIDTTNLWNDYGKEISKYFLLDARIVSDGWINAEWINKYIEKKNLEVNYVNKFLGLLAYEIWYRIFITKEMRNDEELNF
jgi:asparagine synthase (glutamine-hydrolysing)